MISPTRLIPLVGMIAVQSGCMVGADFESPAAPSSVSYSRMPLVEQTSSAPGPFGEAQRLHAGADIERDWWRHFGSWQLVALVEQALRANHDLEAAEASLRQAWHTYQAQAGSTLYPQIGGSLGGQRQQINRAALGQPQESKLFNLFHATVGVSYDLDLSGGVRHGLEALAAQVDEKSYRLAGARLAVAGNVVTTSLAQAQIREQIRIVEDILAVQQEQLDLGRKRFSLGIVSEHEVLTLQSQFEETRALLPALRRQLEQTNDLLAVLVGQSPAEAAVPAFSLDDFRLPTELPVSLPSELVRQRPDIQSSEAILQAAVAQHGVSVARLYPRLALSADMGTQALTIGGLFGNGSMIWSLAGNLTQPLFNKGLRAEARAAEAGIDAAAAAYRQTVLQAFVEVADVLRALESNTQTLDARYAAHQSALKTLNLVRRQHELGVVSYIDVLIAQRQSLQAQEALLGIQVQRLIDAAALYQAMGGGMLVSGLDQTE